MRRLALIGAALVLIATVVLIRRENPLLRMLWPPSDLYSTRAEAPLDIAKPGASAALAFAPKYLGSHAVELHFPGQPEVFSARKVSPLVLDVNVVVEGGGQWRETAKSTDAYRDRGGSGFIIFWAGKARPWSPGADTQVTVSVVEPDAELEKSYGPALIRAVKLSDK